MSGGVAEVTGEIPSPRADRVDLPQPDNKYVVINRAYIVSLKPNEKGAVLAINKEAIGYSSIHVMPNDVQLLKEWLLVK